MITLDTIRLDHWLDFKDDPKLLADFLLDEKNDALRFKEHRQKATALITRVAHFAANGALDIALAIKIRRIFSLILPNPDLFIHSSQNPLGLSKLILMEQGQWFQSLFLGSYSDSKIKDLPIERFAYFLTAPLLENLYHFMMTQDDTIFKDLSEEDIWSLIQQCHCWNLFFALKKLQIYASKFVTDSIKALEMLDGARAYGLSDLEVCCRNVISKASVHLTLHDDNTISASLTSFNQETEKAVSGISSSISSLSLGDAAIEDKIAINTLSRLTSLDRLTLTLTKQGISEIAKETLNQCTSLHTLRLQMCNGNLMGPPPTSPRESPITFSHILQLDLRKLSSKNKQNKRVALGTLQLMDNLQDIRMSGCAFVDDSFLNELIRNRLGIKMLDIGHCHKVSDVKLLELLKTLPSLEVINLSGINATNDTLIEVLKNCSNLRHLNLTACSLLRRGLFERSSHYLGKLNYLNLTSVHNLGDQDWDTLFLVATKLHYLNVAHSKSFHLSMLVKKQLLSIQELVLSNFHLEGMDLSLLTRAFPNLKKLHVEGHTSCELRDNLKRLSCLVETSDISFAAV